MIIFLPSHLIKTFVTPSHHHFVGKVKEFVKGLVVTTDLSGILKSVMFCLWTRQMCAFLIKKNYLPGLTRADQCGSKRHLWNQSKFAVPMVRRAGSSGASTQVFSFLRKFLVRHCAGFLLVNVVHSREEMKSFTVPLAVREDGASLRQTCFGDAWKTALPSGDFVSKLFVSSSTRFVNPQKV